MAKLYLSLVLLLGVIMSLCVAFMPSASVSKVRSTSTIVMDGKTRALRDRIKSVKNTRRITEAMRLVAAARVRRAQEAVLKSRPLLAQLQLVTIIFRIKLNFQSWPLIKYPSSLSLSLRSIKLY